MTKVDGDNININDSNNYTLEKKGGRYLFGDYTPFDENKNFINMLKDFVSVSSNIIQIHKNVERLRFVLNNAELLENEMIAKIKQLKNSTDTSMDAFHKKYHEDIINALFPTPTGTDLFFQIKNALIHQLTDGEKEYARHSEEYKKYIHSKIEDFYKNAAILLQDWLSKDNFNLPSALTSNLLNIVEVSIDQNDDNNSYMISRTSSIATHKKKSVKFADTAIDDRASYLFYSFIIDVSSIEFWSHKRKVSDLGIDNMLLPVGFKTPISEKLKRSFRFVSRGEDDQTPVVKDPEFISADDYYLSYLKLEGSKTLFLILADDASKLDDKVMKINYDMAYWYQNDFNDKVDVSAKAEFYNRLISEGKVPKIDYIQDKETRRLNLFQKEFLQFTDISKIFLLGKVLIDKMNSILNPKAIASHIKLESIKVDDKDAIKVNRDSAKSPSLLYNEELVISFLESVATGFAPLILKLKTKSPVEGELILRYETGDKQREEYVIRTEEINSQLSSTNEGKRISSILGLSNNVSSDMTRSSHSTTSSTTSTRS
ncbi:MAG TPA: hypothetical protein VE244_08210 [Nitrososphaeraceae archaeon]|jgi:hypothetical protein|nr:hypothetical protein [Nitrososphaeraceae archaeon]